MAGATDTFGIVLKNDLRECARLRQAIDDFTEMNKFPEEERFELQACLQEAVLNIVKYGFDDNERCEIDIQMLFQRNSRLLTIRIADDGRMFGATDESSMPRRESQAQRRSPDDPRLHAVRRYAHDMTYFRHGRYHHLVLSRLISEASGSAA